MPVNIHGKSYNTVAERIATAGGDLLGVNTKVLSHDPVVIKAIISTPKGMFSGISAANPSKSMEAESPYEVAETSAVGRALAFAGYETTNGIASAEEVRKATTSPLNTPDSALGACPKCGKPLKPKMTKKGEAIVCSAGGWDSVNRKAIGCDFIKWPEEPDFIDADIDRGDEQPKQDEQPPF